MKTNTIITIGRQYGSAGRQIGRVLAEELGIKCTSVVGSTGIMTVQSLLENVIQAYVYQN